MPSRTAYEPVEVPAYVEFTITLADRPAHQTPLTAGEAAAMSELGFRFAIYRPESVEFAISQPYVTILDRQRGTLTFQQ